MKKILKIIRLKPKITLVDPYSPNYCLRITEMLTFNPVIIIYFTFEGGIHIDTLKCVTEKQI